MPSAFMYRLTEEEIETRVAQLVHEFLIPTVHKIQQRHQSMCWNIIDACFHQHSSGIVVAFQIVNVNGPISMHLIKHVSTYWRPWIQSVINQIPKNFHRSNIDLIRSKHQSSANMRFDHSSEWNNSSVFREIDFYLFQSFPTQKLSMG